MKPQCVGFNTVDDGGLSFQNILPVGDDGSEVSETSLLIMNDCDISDNIDTDDDDSVGTTDLFDTCNAIDGETRETSTVSNGLSNRLINFNSL